MTGRFDKYAWFKAVYAEIRFTDGEKAVLGYIAVVNVFNGKDTFCVRQSTIAAQCGISVRTVGGAIRRAKELKYLDVKNLHARGTGRHGADELRLSHPAEWSEDSSLHSDPSGVKQTTEWCEGNDPSGVKETTEWSEADPPPTSANMPPNGSLERFSNNGSGRGGAERANPPDVSAPSDGQNNHEVWLDEPRCDEHRNTPRPPKCHRCQSVREQREAANNHRPTGDDKVRAWAEMGAGLINRPKELP